MRIARKTVYNKTTGKAVFTSTWHHECNNFIAQQSNPDEFVIVCKWMNI